MNAMDVLLNCGFAESTTIARHMLNSGQLIINKQKVKVPENDNPYTFEVDLKDGDEIRIHNMVHVYKE